MVKFKLNDFNPERYKDKTFIPNNNNSQQNEENKSKDGELKKSLKNLYTLEVTNIEENSPKPRSMLKINRIQNSMIDNDSVSDRSEDILLESARNSNNSTSQ